jgi:hypothetical protein
MGQRVSSLIQYQQYTPEIILKLVKINGKTEHVGNKNKD